MLSTIPQSGNLNSGKVTLTRFIDNLWLRGTLDGDTMGNRFPLPRGRAMMPNTKGRTI